MRIENSKQQMQYKGWKSIVARTTSGPLFSVWLHPSTLRCEIVLP